MGGVLYGALQSPCEDTRAYFTHADQITTRPRDVMSYWHTIRTFASHFSTHHGIYTSPPGTLGSRTSALRPHLPADRVVGRVAPTGMVACNSDIWN